MTVMTETPAFAPEQDLRLSFPRILRSEWLKLTSLRSTIWSLALIVVLGIGLSLAMAATVRFASSEGFPTGPSAEMTVMVATVGISLAQLIAAVLGVLVISGEFSTGMIRSTLAAVPKRLPVLAAKVVVLFLTVTVTGVITLFGAWAATYPLLAGRDIAVPLTEPGVAAALAGGAVYLGLTAVFALGLGTLLRAAAGGIAAALAVILVLPIVLPLLGLVADWVRDLIPYTFSSAGSAMATLVSDAPTPTGVPETLDPWAGAVVVLVWTAASLVLGAIALQRRDA